MEIIIQFGIARIEGKNDGTVTFYSNRCKRTITRKLVKPRPTAHNEEFARAGTAISSIKPSQAYKDNLRGYMIQLRTNKPHQAEGIVNWYNLYVKIMYAMANALPDQVNLETITLAQIEAENLPCRSIKQAVEARLIPKVYRYERFTAQM